MQLPELTPQVSLDERLRQLLEKRIKAQMQYAGASDVYGQAPILPGAKHDPNYNLSDSAAARKQMQESLQQDRQLASEAQQLEPYSELPAHSDLDTDYLHQLLRMRAQSGNK